MANVTSLVVRHWRLLQSVRVHGALDLDVSGNGSLVMLPLGRHFVQMVVDVFNRRGVITVVGASLRREGHNIVF